MASSRNREHGARAVALGAVLCAGALGACIDVEAIDPLPAAPDVAVDGGDDAHDGKVGDVLADVPLELPPPDGPDDGAADGDLGPDAADADVTDDGSDSGETDAAPTCVPEECDDGGPCTVGTCDEATDTCIYPSAEDGTECDDGDACTTGDACMDGSCSSSGIDLCNDENPCTSDSCDSATGCEHFDFQGTACEDDDPCTTGDSCSGGTCQPGTTAKVCPDDDDDSCMVPICDSAVEGGCTTQAGNEGGSCEDGNACTHSDVCASGFCKQGPFVQCDTEDPCKTSDCDEVTGLCVEEAANEGGACDDGDLCTVGDFCAQGVCQAGGGAPTCDDGDPCTEDYCDAAKGGCATKTAPGSPACDDGNPCTVGDVCAFGACKEGSDALDCDDDNECTTNFCSEGVGCQTTPKTGQACDDQDACTSGDVCDAQGTCAGTTMTCDDSNGCTDDSCSSAVGCVYQPNVLGCDDGDACTSADVCASGSCGGNPLDCDDGNPCTSDFCHTQDGCQTTPLTGSPCNDGDACTDNDFCDAQGLCGGDAVVCDDSNGCTDDSCDSLAGCVYEPNGNPCDDDDPCTVGDTCGLGGSCVSGGGEPDCPEGAGPCQFAACDPATGCYVGDKPFGTSCPDQGDGACSWDVCDGEGGCGLPRTGGFIAGSGPGEFRDVVALAGGGWALTGWHRDQDTDKDIMWLVRLDEQAQDVWQFGYLKNLGFLDWSQGYALAERPGGGFAVIGRVNLILGGGLTRTGYAVVDADGAELYGGSYGNSDDGPGRGVVALGDGDLILMADVYQQNGPPVSTGLLRMAPPAGGWGEGSPSTIWEAIYGAEGSAYRGHAILETSDGAIAFAGRQPAAPDADNPFDNWVVTLEADTSDVTAEWQPKYDTDWDEDILAMAEWAPGELLLVGRSGYYCNIMLIDGTGEITKPGSLDAPYPQVCTDVVPTGTGTMAVSGYHENEAGGVRGIVASLKAWSSAWVEKDKVEIADVFSVAYGLAPTPEGGYLVVGVALDQATWYVVDADMELCD